MGKAQPSFDQGLLPFAHLYSDWKIPSELPDLSREVEVAIDTETYDPSLKNNTGPGFFKCDRNDPNTGFICGISAAWRDQKIYIPLRHNRKNYYDRDLVRRWLHSLARQDNTRFIFHNFQYDWGWIQSIFDIRPPMLLDDTAAMASMVNENLSSFSLDALCAEVGILGKDERLLKEHARVHKVKESELKHYMHEYDVGHVGPYAEQDAVSTLTLAQKLRPLLEAENLNTAYQVERDLMPLTLKMKQRGIRIDIERTRQLKKEIDTRCDEDLFKLGEMVGQRVTRKEIRSNKWLKDQFDVYHLTPPRTPASEHHSEGQASFEKNFMANHEHPFPRAVHGIKHRTDLAEKFLQKFIIEYEYKGRVHPSINQFRSETGGARSHRFSYADPALQQIPSKDDEYAPLIRSCFIPEEGDFWCSIDYRQQEYRLIVFVAETIKARGAKKAGDRYRTDPNTDFHDYVAQITRLPRRQAKDVNFAKAYGAGVRKFALMTGMDDSEAERVMEKYDTELPFVRETSSRYTKIASEHGYIKLIDKARNHFNLWEPIYRDYAREWEYKQKYSNIDIKPCTEEESLRRKNDIHHPWNGERMKRAYTHKAFNRMIQGSAARQMKKAMVDTYRAGYLPLLQLHDELCFSFKDMAEAQACAKIMEEAMPIISIPMLTDIKVGPSWGQLKK